MIETRPLQIEKGTQLPLMEDFYTLQGEGFHSGKAAYFIRLGGCDVGCHWCDVKESWDAEIHTPEDVALIARKSRKFSNTVVVTGGEPLMYNMEPLTQALHEEGKQVHVETSGAHPLTGSWDWICLSPKKNKPPHAEFYGVAHELKIIIYNKHDFQWAEEHAARVGAHCHLYLQPEWSKREKMIPLINDYVMQNPKWRLGLQTHKYIGLP